MTVLGVAMPQRRRRALAVIAASAALTGIVAEAGRPSAPPLTAVDSFAGFVGGESGDREGRFAEPSDATVYVGELKEPDDDRIFVADAGNARVQVLDAAGNFALMWGREGTSAGEFDWPTGVAVDQATYRVYVMDLGNRRVQQFDRYGNFARAWGWGVATGRAAFEVCESRCRAGRIGGREGNDNPGQFADSVNGSIAVSPADGDVFVTDGSNRRVLQFSSRGRFLRAWGRGVASGSSRLESCASVAGCRRGVPIDLPEDVTERSWPRHVAVGNDGVVYLSEASHGDRILRFDPDAKDPERSRLAPLSADSGLLTSGITSGLEVDPRDGRLVVARNPFGPIVVDLISRPGARLGGAAPPRVSRIVVPSYLDSVNGVAVDVTGDVFLVKSSKLNRRDPAAALNDCPGPDGDEPCHGLALLTAGDALESEVTITAPTAVSSSTATLNGVIVPRGVVRYRFQLSTDGRTWRDIGPSRYVAGSRPAVVAELANGLRPARPYMARLVADARPGSGEALLVSASERAFVTSAAAEAPARAP